MGGQEGAQGDGRWQHGRKTKNVCVVGRTFFMNAANCVAAGSAAAANARIAKRMTVFMAICVSEQTGRTMLLATSRFV